MRRREHPHPRGRQLDGERKAVQQSHRLGHRIAIAVAEDEVRHLRAGAGDEQVDRIHRHGQGLERKQLLARQVQPLAAGDDEARLDGAVEPAADGVGGVRDDLLEVVEDDQAASAAGDGVPELHAGIVLAQGDAERDGHRAKNAIEALGVAQVAEVDAARPVAEPGPAVAADEAGLAGAARAENRDQPAAGVEPGGERAQVRGAADEGVALGGQVVADLAHRPPEVAVMDHPVGLVDVRRRRERRGARRAQLEDPDRLLDPLQPVVAVRLDRRAVGNAVGKRFARGGAQQRLPAAGERHDAGRERLGEALGLDRLGAVGDVFGRVLAQGDRADVDARPGR